jgi:hypothetical protein
LFGEMIVTFLERPRMLESYAKFLQVKPIAQVMRSFSSVSGLKVGVIIPLALPHVYSCGSSALPATAAVDAVVDAPPPLPAAVVAVVLGGVLAVGVDTLGLVEACWAAAGAAASRLAEAVAISSLREVACIECLSVRERAADLNRTSSDDPRQRIV